MTEELIARLKTFLNERVNQCKVLVVGDVMLDKYYFGEVTRISPEAPVPITHVLKTKDQLGGAANVAHNLALLGADTSIIGFVGDDHHGETLICSRAASITLISCTPLIPPPPRSGSSAVINRCSVSTSKTPRPSSPTITIS